MKKFITMILTCILLLNLIIVVPVSAAVDNTKYIPKIVVEKGKSKLVFDPKIAEIAKKMLSDAYRVEKGTTTSIAKTERSVIAY